MRLQLKKSDGKLVVAGNTGEIIEGLTAVEISTSKPDAPTTVTIEVFLHYMDLRDEDSGDDG